MEDNTMAVSEIANAEITAGTTSPVVNETEITSPSVETESPEKAVKTPEESQGEATSADVPEKTEQRIKNLIDKLKAQDEKLKTYEGSNVKNAQAEALETGIKQINDWEARYANTPNAMYDPALAAQHAHNQAELMKATNELQRVYQETNNLIDDVQKIERQEPLFDPSSEDYSNVAQDMFEDLSLNKGYKPEEARAKVKSIFEAGTSKGAYAQKMAKVEKVTVTQPTSKPTTPNLGTPEFRSAKEMREYLVKQGKVIE